MMADSRIHLQESESEDEDWEQEDEDEEEDEDSDVEMDEPKKFTPSARKKKTEETPAPESVSSIGSSVAQDDDDTEASGPAEFIDDGLPHPRVSSAVPTPKNNSPCDATMLIHRLAF
jgi:hypothetical protein